MRPFYWAILAALVWGCVPALEKMGLAKIPPLTGLFYRSLGVLAGAVFLLFFNFESIREAFMAPKIGLLYLILGGILASILGQIFFYHALKSGETSLVVPVAAAYPLITFLIGVLFFMMYGFIKDFLNMNSIAGALLVGILVYWMVLSNFLVILEFPYNAILFWSVFGITCAYRDKLKGK